MLQKSIQQHGRPTLDLSIVIPAYNEEGAIGNFLKSVVSYISSRARLAEVIVVDDGSTDRTANEVFHIRQKEDRIRLLSHPFNRGKGAAVKTGMLEAKGAYVAFLDADGSTPVQELDRLLFAFEQSCDIAIGSRYLPGSSITVRQPLVRVALGRIGNWIVRHTLLRGIYDTQCGCKMISYQATRAIVPRLTIDSWGFDMELLAIAKDMGYSVCEVPIDWHDVANRKSRFRPFRDSHKTLKDLFVIKWNLLRGRYG